MCRIAGQCQTRQAAPDDDPRQEGPCPQDRVNRQFRVPALNMLWVGHFTDVATWKGFVYVAFVIDTYVRRILGWRAGLQRRPWSHRHEVRRGALQFPGVLDDHDAIGGLGHFGEQRIPQRGLLEPLAMLNIPMGYGLGKGTSRAPTRIEIRPDGTILRHDGAIQAP